MCVHGLCLFVFSRLYGSTILFRSDRPTGNRLVIRLCFVRRVTIRVDYARAYERKLRSRTQKHAERTVDDFDCRHKSREPRRAIIATVIVKLYSY